LNCLKEKQKVKKLKLKSKTYNVIELEMSILEFVSLLPSYILHFSAQVCTEVKPAVAKIAADFIHQEISWQNLLRNPSFSAIKAACVVLK
jgi:hypothetical protein